MQLILYQKLPLYNIYKINLFYSIYIYTYISTLFFINNLLGVLKLYIQYIENNIVIFVIYFYIYEYKFKTNTIFDV